MVAASGDVPGRVVRTAILGFLAPGFGAGVFEAAADPVGAVLPFVLMMLISGALILELTDQARRLEPDGAVRWARTDTAIVVALVVYAAMFPALAVFRHLPSPERTSASCFAALYLILVGCFCFVRLRRRRQGASERPGKR